MTSWLAPMIVLAGGLLVGFALWRRVSRRSASPVDTPDDNPRLQLESRRDALLAHLRELPEGDARQGERLALERQAARVLRDLDQMPAASRDNAATTPAVRVNSARPALRGFLWGAGTVAGVGLLVFLASRSATERPEGGSMTGNTGTARAAEADPELQTLQEAVRGEPDDMDARLALAQAALGREDLMQVFEQTRYVLDRQPGHPRALSYQALVRLAMGQSEMALRMLQQALATEPDLLEAYLHLALVHVRMGNPREGEAAVAEAARRAPAQAPRLRALWAEMQRLGRGRGDVPAAEAHASVEAPPSASDPAGVAGIVDLAPALKARLRGDATLFIVVRAEGARSGPPVAVKRMAATGWPIAFRVGAADSMMGESLPGRLRIEARVDSDGDPLTRDPADPAGSQDSVPAGTTGLRLVLK